MDGRGAVGVRPGALMPLDAMYPSHSESGFVKSYAVLLADPPAPLDDLGGKPHAGEKRFKTNAGSLH